jgi:hypothetical protein
VHCPFGRCGADASWAGRNKIADGNANCVRDRNKLIYKKPLTTAFDVRDCCPREPYSVSESGLGQFAFPRVADAATKFFIERVRHISLIRRAGCAAAYSA